MANYKSAVLQQLDQLNTELSELFTSLASYDDTQLNAPPAVGAWSALQALHHLLLSESLALAYCQKKLSFEPNLAKSNLSTRLRSFVVKHYDRVPFKAKAPKMVGHEKLPAQSKLAELQTAWIAQRTALADFLKSQPEVRFQQEVFKHPFAGRLDFSGMLDFFQGHFRRHRKQAYRAIGHLS